MTLRNFVPFQPIGIHNGKYEWASRPSSGDCSLKIMNVDIKFDDGAWECQVTSADFQSQDALASAPARLVVRGSFTFDSITCLWLFQIGSALIFLKFLSCK
jgi:hypothetical protein